MAKKKKKFKVTIDMVYPKPKSKYDDTISEAKRRARHILENNPQGVARIKQLKTNGKSYKSKSSHYWVRSRKTGRVGIVGL
ncbi:hypothetical protein LCGC14_2030420 [marine sediment metagenome]|uniref:Uncharacterized protein n=1 Tax=marine sediment metagenome TaxID=412755 RepID=A0A0F9FHF6_9ZZZZ